MSINGRERLSSFLFDQPNWEVLDLKFLRGKSVTLTADEMCESAQGVLEAFFASETHGNVLPNGRRPQRDVAEILASY